MRTTRLYAAVLGSLVAVGSACSSSDTNDAGLADSGVVNPTDTGLADNGVHPDALVNPDATPADSGVHPDAAPPPDTGPNPDAMVTDTGPGPTGRTIPTNGSHIALSPADNIAIASNRTANVVTVLAINFAAMPPSATENKRFTIDDPGAAVVGNSGDNAYVLVKSTGQVQEITGLKNGMNVALGRTAEVGGAPSGIAISPSGAKLFVANFADGTVSVVNTADMTVAGTVDLNASIAATNLLGDGLASRPGLAHPYAIAVTNDGDADDNDETVYVTEFFSVQRPAAGLPADDSFFDVGRQALVYRFPANSTTPGAIITIAPTADTNFRDSNDARTGCFPNQLYAATINRGRLFVTGVCESPRGPTGPVVNGAGMTLLNNFKTEIHTAIYVVNTQTNMEEPAKGILLTDKFQQLYDTAMTPDTAARRIPLIANDIAFVPNNMVAYVTAYGSDAVFRVVYDAQGMFQSVGSNLQPFINLGGGTPAGRLPIGLALSTTTQNAVVLNENTRNVSFVAFQTQNVVSGANTADQPTAGSEEDNINKGRRFFVTGNGRWSLRGQAWNSCEACHPGGLTDNVTWFFARGPRQTTSLDGTYSPNGQDVRFMNWTAIFDEVHDFELNTRGNSGGVGAIVHTVSMPPANTDRINFDNTNPNPMGNLKTRTPQNGLNGSVQSLIDPARTSSVSTMLTDWNEIAAYVRSIKAPYAPKNLVAADVTDGRMIFEQNNCAGCHGGASWTLSRRFYTPNETNNAVMGLLRTMMYTAPMAFPPALNPPSNNAGRTATLRFAEIASAGANDQINCVLRNVGTFPAPLDMTTFAGVAPAGVRVKEVRTNMTTAAQGATGMNPPSLFGMGSGAPYFHAGNARSLEEVFSPTFNAHHTALSANFLTGADRGDLIRKLIAFLNSIQDDTPPATVPAGLGFNPILCPTSL